MTGKNTGGTEIASTGNASMENRSKKRPNMQGWKMQVRKNQVQNKVQISTENTTKITLRTMRNNRAHTESV